MAPKAVSAWKRFNRNERFRGSIRSHETTVTPPSASPAYDRHGLNCFRRTPMLNSSTLLAALQTFLDQRRVDVERLTAEPMVAAMFDWTRFGKVASVEGPPVADVLVYRYGGWSEGCATGFKLSLLRRVTERDADGRDTDWYAGITLMFEPSRFAGVAPFSTVSTEWPSTEAFLRAIESSPAYKASASTTPMGVVMESGGLR